MARAHSSPRSQRDRRRAIGPSRQPEARDPAAAFVAGWRAQTVRSVADPIEQRLAEADPRLGRVIARVTAAGKVRRFGPPNTASPFDAVARSIIYQQLSMQAAATIYGRVSSAVGGELRPPRLLATSAQRLRRCGLSRAKIRYLRALATAVIRAELDLAQLEQLPDARVVEQLTRLPGVGIWTAQMFLMFQLRRPDVLPLHDAGIRRGLQLAHGLEQPPSAATIASAGERWSPQRSIASLYLWAAVELGYRAQ
jgi:DNA-3-methyladenine glycosylase II